MPRAKFRVCNQPARARAYTKPGVQMPYRQHTGGCVWGELTLSDTISKHWIFVKTCAMMTNMKFVFQFGTFPDLSEAELITRCPHFAGGARVAGRFYVVEGADSPEWIMANLGGTVKIFELIEAKPTAPSAEKLARHILSRVEPDQKVVFGISTVGAAEKTLGLEVKRQIQEISGRPVRFVISKQKEFSSVTTEMEHLLAPRGVEILILKEKGTVFVAEAVAIQPFEEFSHRDYGRPGRNATRGMLPPKLAKMMVNLAIGHKNTETATIYDPFCGSGTVLMEAALVGAHTVVGSDNSRQAVADAQKLLQWSQTEFGLTTTAKIFEHDARRVLSHLKHGSVDAVVSEFFLGRPLKDKNWLQKNEVNELKTLYQSALFSVTPLLKPDGVVVLATPYNPQGKFGVGIIKIAASAGFVPAPLLKNHETVPYFRENQFMGREISRFIKK